MHEAEKLSLEGICRFVEASEGVRFEGRNREQFFSFVMKLEFNPKLVAEEARRMSKNTRSQFPETRLQSGQKSTNFT
ncbi:MAG: hypothetical protein ACRD3N_10465 [Terracidiphilus sp.]